MQQGYLTDGPNDGDVVRGAYGTNDANVGIRNNALDCPVGSANATHCPGTAGAGTGGFDFGDMGRVIAYNDDTDLPFFEVHADGEIWAETLWDLRHCAGQQPVGPALRGDRRAHREHDVPLPARRAARGYRRRPDA